MKQPAVSVVNPATILSISPIEEDHASLERILSRSDCPMPARTRWTIRRERKLDTALAVLQENRFPLIISEHDLPQGSWRDVLEAINTLPDPSLLVVSSRLADEHLWAEALNLGAYDVLAKPFCAEEVIRVLSLAGSHKRNDREIQNRTTLKMAAAS